MELASIPDQLFSQATIEYVGFDKQKAAEIWNGWVNWPAGEYEPVREIDPDDGSLQVSFLDWVKGHAGSTYSNDVWQDDDAAWWNCMQQRGISTELQQAIMDPHFKYIRLTGTCIGWVRDTIKMRYAGLEASLPDPSNSRTGLFQGLRNISDMTIDCCSSPRAMDSQNESEKTVLFKAIDSARAARLLDNQGRFDHTMELASAPPTDFSQKMSMYYFTTSFEVAKRQAAWAKRRAKYEFVVVIRIAVRNSVIEGLSEGKIQRIHWPNPEWKDLVWRCRTKKRSKELGKYGAASLIIGTMANRPNNYYEQYESGNQLPESCVLKVDGPRGVQPAIQFVFSTELEGETLLEEQAAETLQIFSFTRADMERWMQQHPNEANS